MQRHPDQHTDCRQRDQQGQRPKTAQVGHTPRQPQSQLARRREIDGTRRQVRQHVARHQRRRTQAGDGIQTQLRQPRKAGKHQRGKAEHRSQHAQPDGGPETLRPGSTACSPAGAHTPRLHEVIDAVVHRLADQRGAEPHGNAMHHPEHQTHGRNAHHHRREHRHQTHADRPRGTVDQQQQRQHRQKTGHRQARGFAADGVARIDGKHRRPGKQQLDRLQRRILRLNVGKRLSHRAQRLLLGIRIGAGRARLRHQDGPLSVPGRPHTTPARPVGAVQLIHQRQQLAGRVTRKEFLEQHAGRGAQHVDGLRDGLAQPLHAEMPVLDGRAEQIAVLEQEDTVLLERLGGPIGHDGKAIAGAHLPGQRLRSCLALLLRAPFQPHQQHARHTAHGDLVHQQLLLLARTLRQKGRHVGSKGAAGDHQHADHQCQQPDPDRPATPETHATLPALCAKKLTLSPRKRCQSARACRNATRQTGFSQRAGAGRSADRRKKSSRKAPAASRAAAAA